MYVYSVIVKK